MSAQFPREQVLTRVQLPLLAPSNQFFTTGPRLTLVEHPILEFRRSAGFVALNPNLSIENLRHDHDWLEYSEPAGHSTEVVEFLSRAGINVSDSRFVGVSWKDEDLLKAIAGVGQEKLLLRHYFHLEHGQRYWFDSIDAQAWVAEAKFGDQLNDADVVVCRHLLEHAESPEMFLKMLLQGIREGGSILIEVPDCEPAFRNLDYSILWEEHRAYFTEESLANLCLRCGAVVLESQRLRVENEDVIMVLIRKVQGEACQTLPDRQPSTSGFDFVNHFLQIRLEIGRILDEFLKLGDIIILGANHAGINFIDLFTSPGVIRAVIDDNLHKQGSLVSTYLVPVQSRLSIDDFSCSLVLNAIRSPKGSSLVEAICESKGPSVILTLSALFVRASAPFLPNPSCSGE